MSSSKSSSEFPDSNHLAKIQALTKSLSSAKKTFSSDLLNASELASDLFLKAPADFLNSHTVEDLLEITRQCAETLNAASKDSAPPQIIATTISGHPALIVALADLPFIVNTITETLRHAKIAVQTVLYPIIQRANQRFSLNYIEIAVSDAAATQEIVQHLQLALADLLLVTSDFSQLLVHTETLARLFDQPSYHKVFARSENGEIAALLRWLIDGNFVFLGHASWRIAEKDSVADQPEELRGMFRTTQPYLHSLLEESKDYTQQILDSSTPIAIQKLATESTVHRMRHVTHFAMQELSPDGTPVAVHSIIGLLTSKALSQECSTIPLVRRRTQSLLESEGAIEQAHEFKNIVNLIDRMPKEEALRLNLEELRALIRAVLEGQHAGDLRVHLRLDRDLKGTAHGLSAVVLQQRDRFTAQVRYAMQDEIEAAAGISPGSAQFHLDVSNKPYVRLYFYAPLRRHDETKIDLENLRTSIIAAGRSWSENLSITLQSRAKQATVVGANGHNLDARYRDAFPADYQTLFSVEDAEFDIRAIETLNQNNRIKIALSFCHTNQVQQLTHETAARLPSINAANLSIPSQFTLIVYAMGCEITLSKAVPLLENTGLEVVNEHSTKVSLLGGETTYVHRFSVRAFPPGLRSRSDFAINLTAGSFERILAPGLTKIFSDSLTDLPTGNDPLNSLMLTAGLSLSSISALRAYCYLLWQVNKSSTRRTVITTLASTPIQAAALWQMFELRFDPAISVTLEQRQQEYTAALQNFRESLREVRDLTKDRILRSLSTLLENSVRTNFYIKRTAVQDDLVVIKLESEKIEIMPQPRPKYEIYMHSAHLEGVHLRSGSVARGGIRWSERYEDFRSEVLGLMKTQKIKNVVIVPTGAKGGFIVKNMPSDPKLVPEAVRNTYRDFIRALLSITDNRQGASVVGPENVIRHDGDDPYFVVAADKGTATFSDLANSIAVNEYKFWLGDAFASGGSNGYDHKIYGITARGAWECTKRLFQDGGIDYDGSTFTVVGIGDMGGDVFGNGLLMTSHMRLVAAFNHKHIFIDPTPDHDSAFAERKRLFTTPGSQWSDYDPKLISKGGGVFGRLDKEIALTPEIRNALSVPSYTPDVVDGEFLIGLILRAKVDLLWNGGIGTYVKSSEELNTDVQDSGNDQVRVNADELRVRAVAEGGNLGFTQRARIEFALLGGLINSDAIDNSGGVDLSDHEVNLKILFAGLMQSGELTVEQRNKLLKEMATEVCEAVLDHNRGHALLLTQASLRSRQSIEHFQSLIRFLAKLGFVNRALERLPDDEEMQDRGERNEGLVRPELAVCAAAVKMWVKEDLLASSLTDEPRLKPYLIQYFPTAVRERFPKALQQHPLAANIIATEATNLFLEELGITFVHRMTSQLGCRTVSVVQSWLAARELVEAESLRETLATLNHPHTSKQFVDGRIALSDLLRSATAWLLTHHKESETLEQLIAAHKVSWSEMLSTATTVLSAEDLAIVKKSCGDYERVGLSNAAASRVAVLPIIPSLFDIVWNAHLAQRGFVEVAQITARVADELCPAELLRTSRLPAARGKWEREVLQSALDEIRRNIGRISAQLLATNLAPEQVSAQLKNLSGNERVRSVVEELRSGGCEVAGLAVLGRALTAIAHV